MLWLICPLCSEPLEDYYKNYREQISMHLSSDISRASFQTSRDILKGVEEIKLITNQTLENLNLRIGVLTQAPRNS